jgi:hypothetical protein
MRQALLYGLVGKQEPENHVGAAVPGRPSFLWRSLDGKGAATEDRPYIWTKLSRTRSLAFRARLWARALHRRRGHRTGEPVDQRGARSEDRE